MLDSLVLRDGTTSSTAPLGEYDAILAAASWEPRSCEIVNRLDDKNVKKVAVVRFLNDGKAQKNPSEQTFKTGFSGRKLRFFEFDSVNINEVDVRDLCASIIDWFGSAKTVLIDVSSLPRIVWMSLSKKLFDIGAVKAISYIYENPVYDLQPLSAGSGFSHTGVYVKAQRPVGFPHRLRSLPRKVNIITAGMEHTHYLRFIEEEAGASNHLIFGGNPRYEDVDSYINLTTRELEQKISIFDPHYKVHSLSDSFDLKGLVSKVDEICIDENISRGENKSVRLYCAGNKFQSVGFLWLAMTRTFIDLTVRITSKYEKKTTRSAGTYAYAKILDRFDLDTF